MKIDHRNTLTPTEIIKGGLKQVQKAIKQNSEEVFVVRSSRSDEEMAIMSVTQAEQLFDLQEVMDLLVDEIVLDEFYARKEKSGGFDVIEIPLDPSIVLSKEERYVPRSKRQKAGAL